MWDDVVAELVRKHSGVDVSKMGNLEALGYVRATMVYLAALATAGNRLAVAFDRGEDPDAAEQAVGSYIESVARALDVREQVCGVSVVREGCRRFEVG